MEAGISDGAGLEPEQSKVEDGAVRSGAMYGVLGAWALGLMLGGPPPMRASGPEPARGAQTISSSEASVDINHASVESLMKVPGMTRSWAGRIVRFRPYHAKSDLVQRGVLPSEVYDRIEGGVIAHREKEPGAAGQEAGRTAKGIPPPEARVDINHASIEALMKVPGMTRSLAKRIVHSRPYHSKRDLLKRGLVTSEVYSHIKDDVIAHRERR